MIESIGVEFQSIEELEAGLMAMDQASLGLYFTESELGFFPKKELGEVYLLKNALIKLLGLDLAGVDKRQVEIRKPGLELYSQVFHGELEKIYRSKSFEKIELILEKDRESILAMAKGFQFFEDDYWPILSRRDIRGHKGSYGRLGVVAGSKGMSGSNYLASMAGLRTGSGLVYSIVPNCLLDIMSIKLIEAIVVALEDEEGYFSEASINSLADRLKLYDSLVLGPGLGYKQGIFKFVDYIVENYEKTLLIDADGLNILGYGLDILDKRKNKTIITPHPGEFSRLMGKNIQDIEKNRVRYSIEFARKYKVIVVLKGYRTVVTDGERVYINRTGNPGMATAGSGDLLSGIIGSLLSQGLEAYKAASYGVYIHGLAGDIARDELGEYGMIARDILERIPRAIELSTIK